MKIEMGNSNTKNLPQGTISFIKIEDANV